MPFEINKKQYQKIVEKNSPSSCLGKNMLMAFLTGGIICTLAQLISFAIEKTGLPESDCSTYISCIMIFIGSLLTGIGVYDDIARFAGGGTLVPITGFANSITSPAIEYKTEGYILGVGAKMFIIAGPVLVYGISASVLYGFIYYFLLR